MSRETLKSRALDTINHPRDLFIVFVCNFSICGLIYALLEDKGPIEGLWWALVTASTVGYGDFYPATTAGRGVGAWLITTTFVLVLALGAHLTRSLIRDDDAWTHDEQEEAKVQRAKILVQQEEAETQRAKIIEQLHRLNERLDRLDAKERESVH